MLKVLRVVLAVVGFLSLARFAHAAEPCVVEARPGVEDADRDAVEEVLCPKLREAAPGSVVRVRVGKLGSKLIVTVLSDGGRGPSEHQVILQNIDELPVATPRLAEAVEEKKPLAETLQVTNVLGEETRVPKKKPSEMHAWLSLGGVVLPPIGVGPVGGFALSGGNDRWSFVGEARVGAVGSIDTRTNILLGFSGGVRHHFTANDIAPFVGIGASGIFVGATQSHVVVVENGAMRRGGVYGLAAGAELGIDLLRTSTVGGAFVLRGDFAAFDVSEHGGSVAWSPIFTAALAMRF
ncbi:MAG: hypothetical protein KIT84_28530 [Labilithrix sp.]|nr:hypothetical protein [Labilithrix sp.]MCW5815006.1 hypothetical protein [Labilithrix sp.]